MLDSRLRGNDGFNRLKCYIFTNPHSLMNGSFDDSPEARTVLRLRRVMAVFTGLLVASTLPLWVDGGGMLQIPWFEWCRDIPGSCFEVLLGVGCLSVLLLLPFLNRVPSRLQRRLSLFCGLMAATLLLFDQHRLQPWVWQMVIAALFLFLSRIPGQTLSCLRALTVSIYFWSAVSKMDWAFLEGHGQLLLNGLTGAVGLSTEMWSETARRVLAATFPVGEAGIALLLAVPSLRRIGVAAAILMHGLLIVTLGPWGLGHEWGVVIWNAFFVVLVWLLFWGGQEVTVAGSARWQRALQIQPQAWFVIVLTWTVCTLPALSLAGLWDWWPSWAVYSSRPALVQMFVSEEEIERLPEALRAHVGAPRPLSRWCPVNLDAWSYATCRCPMYPQERYRLAVIAALAEQGEIEPRVIVRSSPDRWTGERTEQELTGAQLNSRRKRFWLNTLPRELRARPLQLSTRGGRDPRRTGPPDIFGRASLRWEH